MICAKVKTFKFHKKENFIISDLFGSIFTGTVTAGFYLIATAVALLCGIIAAFAASYRTHISKSFLITLILLPAIVETVIIMVNGNVGTGIAVAGAFSLVRFRSVPGKAREIAAIFLAMTAGLAAAAGFVGIALLFTVITSLLMLVLSRIPVKSERSLDLRITIPETVNYATAFDDLFDKYTKNHQFVSVKTTNMGSLYKLLYRVELKDRETTKEFIDALRCRNGNLEIALADAAERGEEL